MNSNPPVKLDGYKVDHRPQYPRNSKLVFSNLTARGSRVDGVRHVVFFGLQYFILRYLIEDWNNNFFSQPKDEVVAKFKRRVDTYLGPGKVSSDHIAALHDLGYLPLEIWALPEGTHVPLRVPMLVVYNTHPDFFWLTNAIETIMSVTLWLPCTSATTAFQYRRLLDAWMRLTAPEMAEFVPWQGHDFSFRGHSSFESATTSGAAHLLSFTGTDTVPAIDFLEEYYGADAERELVGGSVPATEHSVMCMGGMEDEVGTFKRLITEVYPTGIVSIVSDTWDFWNVIDPEGGILTTLKDVIIARDGKVVIRPDSGDPVKIVTGWTAAEVEVAGREISEVERKGLVQCLWEIFGGTISSTGFMLLDSHIGAIYGDSITLERAQQISARLADMNFASTNVVFGIGSFTYQGAITPKAIVTRDTYGFAVKSTYGEVMTPDGIEGIEIFKDPITDDGLKKSAKGLTAVYKNDLGELYLKDQATWDDVRNCAFDLVFKNGELRNRRTLSRIREAIKETDPYA